MVKNLNIETEKFEQTLFAQISLSQYEDSSTACATKHFKAYIKKKKNGPWTTQNLCILVCMYFRISCYNWRGCNFVYHVETYNDIPRNLVYHIFFFYITWENLHIFTLV